jgi:tyrosine-protein kinase Etk/Wzc
MNEMHHTATKPGPGQGGEHMSFVEMLIVLAKRKKVILGTAVAAALVSAGVSMVLPETYKASVRLLPPQQAQSSASMILSQLGGLASAAAGAAGLKNPSDVYIGMLKSRTVAERLADRFALQKHYEVESREKTWDRLEKNTAIIAGKDGLITIQVEDRDQKQVAPLANAYVEELVRLTRTLAVTEAGQRRMFFEQELERSKNNLAKAEMAVKGAIEQRGVVSVDAESRTQLEMIARLRAQVSAKEVERDAMKAFVTPSHPEYQRAEEALASLRAELSRLENGRPAAGNAAAAGGQGLQNIQLLRDVKYYQMLYELLAKQYEAARLDEAKDASVIQVLDPAIAPERRFAPKRALIVIVSTLLAGLLAVGAVLLGEAKRRWLRSPASAGLWHELKSSLRSK